MKNSVANLSFICLGFICGVGVMGIAFSKKLPITNKIFVTLEDSVKIQDEVPGIGNTIDHPDTCIAYYDSTDRCIHWERIKH